MLTDSLMTEKHTPYLFTRNSYHSGYPNQAYRTLERGDEGRQGEMRRGEERRDTSGKSLSLALIFIHLRMIFNPVSTSGMP